MSESPVDRCRVDLYKSKDLVIEAVASIYKAMMAISEVQAEFNKMTKGAEDCNLNTHRPPTGEDGVIKTLGRIRMRLEYDYPKLVAPFQETLVGGGSGRAIPDLPPAPPYDPEERRQRLEGLEGRWW